MFLQYVANIGPKFFFRTNQNARNNRLVTFDFNTFEENQKFTDFIAVIIFFYFLVFIIVLFSFKNIYMMTKIVKFIGKSQRIYGLRIFIQRR